MIKKYLIDCTRETIRELTWKKVAFIIVGAAICTFGVHNIHQRVDITEGGIIGLMLLIERWLGIPSEIITPILDITCYAMALKYFGGKFIMISMVSTISVSVFYKIWAMLPYMMPDLSGIPVLAAVLGGLFVGVGTGIILRQGGSGGGDDALALTLSKVTGWKLANAYLFTDVIVLCLSLSYIPLIRIACSILTVYVSSNAIDKVKNFRRESDAISCGVDEMIETDSTADVKALEGQESMDDEKEE